MWGTFCAENFSFWLVVCSRGLLFRFFLAQSADKSGMHNFNVLRYF